LFPNTNIKNSKLIAVEVVLFSQQQLKVKAAKKIQNNKIATRKQLFASVKEQKGNRMSKSQIYSEKGKFILICF